MTDQGPASSPSRSAAGWPHPDREPQRPRGARELAVRMVYRQAVMAPLVSILVAGLLCLGLRGEVSDGRLLVFLAFTGGSALARTGIVLAFRRRRDPSSIDFWSRLFDGSLIVSCLFWGFGALYVRPADSPLHQAVIFLFVLGMAGGTAVLYVSSRRAATVAVLAFVLPTVVVSALEPTTAFRVLAAAGVVFLVLSIRGILALGSFMVRSFELNEELERARHEAEVLARTDELTGLLNRRAFYEMGQYLVEQASRHDRPLSIVVLDVDRFKEVNDRYGHAAGDATLRAVAGILEQSGRRIDVVGRLGGDELALLLPDTTPRDATGIAERIRERLRGLRIHDRGEEIAVTCSLGVAGSAAERSLDDLVRRADDALYRAKDAGRDRVVGDDD